MTSTHVESTRREWHASHRGRRRLHRVRLLLQSFVLHATVLVFAALTGCEDNPQYACTDEWVYGLRVEVRDAVTGAPAAAGALIVARDGSYADTLQIADSLLAFGAGERGGTYSLTITKTGYRTWQSSDIRVTRNECHVNPVIVQVELMKE